MTRARPMLFPNDLDQDALSPVAVKFAVEYLFPRAEIQFAFGYGHDHFAPHDLTFQMGVSVVLARAIVPVLAGRFVRREFFEPILVILQQAIFRVIYEYCRSYMHGIYQAQTFLHRAFTDQRGYRARYVYKAAPSRHIEFKIFRQRFHAGSSISSFSFNHNEIKK